MGCLFALGAAFFPRIMFLILWIARPVYVDAVFDTWIWPLLGLIFLPWTTVLYTVGYIAGGAAAPWGILGIFVGLFLDIALHARSVTMGRDRYRT